MTEQRAAHTPGMKWKRDVTLDGVVTIREAQEPYRNLFGEVEDAAEHWTVEERFAHADLAAAAPELLKALEANNDLLFGLLDYFDPGHELSQIVAQREKNNELLAAARRGK